MDCQGKVIEAGDKVVWTFLEGEYERDVLTVLAVDTGRGIALVTDSIGSKLWLAHEPAKACGCPQDRRVQVDRPSCRRGSHHQRWHLWASTRVALLAFCDEPLSLLRWISRDFLRPDVLPIDAS